VPWKMKNEFVNYLSENPFEDEGQRKIEYMEKVQDSILKVEKIIGKTILTIFISGEIGENHRITGKSLWLFTEELLIQAPEFTSHDGFHIYFYKHNISQLDVFSQYYNYEEATSRSGFTVDINIAPDIHLRLMAAQENCNRLFSIFKTYILPNLIIPVQ
jgi:hypothetical protein